MGNKQSLKSHLENSQRTGVFQLIKANLRDVPPELFRLPNLRSIDLSGNNLKLLSPAIGQLQNLRTLILNDNQLSTLPDEIGKLCKLETLSVANNQLTTIPETIGELRSLRTLNLSQNRLRKFPSAELANLRQLDYVDLSKNNITEIPDGQVSEINAIEINLNQNQLSRLSPDVARCPRLKVLRIEENCLPLDDVAALLAQSQISLLAADGNLFDMKQLHQHPDYDHYMERYTATKRKI